MALPTEIQPWQDWTRHGIAVGVFPSTQARLGVELQSSTASSLASSQWQSVYMPPSTGGGQMLHTYDQIPMSTRRYYFRARHVGPGVVASSWTPTVSALPTTLSIIVPTPLVNAAGNIEAPGANVIISSGNAPVVGSQNTTSVVTKSIRFPASALLRESSAFQEGRGIGTFVIGSNTSGSYQWQYVMPKGITITQVRYCGTLRPTTAQISLLKFYRVSTAGIASLVATLTMTTGAAASRAVISSSVLSEAVGDANDFIGHVELKTSTAGKPSVIYSEVEYTMGNYTKSY